MSSTLSTVEISQCPECGGELELRYHNLTDLYEQVDDIFSIVECRACGLVATTPKPSGDLDILYPNDYLGEQPQDKQQHGLMQNAERWYRKDQARFDFGLLQRSGLMRADEIQSYCDIGCGTGDRVAYMHGLGCLRSVGIDMFDFFNALTDKNRHFVQTSIFEYMPKEKFQLISLFHVLEHVEEPGQMLKHVAEHLIRHDGVVLIQVPNYASFERVLFGRRWSALDVPRHLWHFRPEYLLKIVEAAGFDVVKVYQRNAVWHPVTTISSIFTDSHLQRNWILGRQGKANYWKAMRLVWAIGTIATIPWNMLLNLVRSASMLSLIAVPRSKRSDSALPHRVAVAALKLNVGESTPSVFGTLSPVGFEKNLPHQITSAYGNER